MVELIWTEMAIDDLNAIAEFIARDSQAYAFDFVRRIINQIEKLAQFPKMGRVVPELGLDSIREIIYHNYRIVYTIKSEKIFIAIVSHGSYDLNDRLNDLS